MFIKLFYLQVSCLLYFSCVGQLLTLQKNKNELMTSVTSTLFFQIQTQPVILLVSIFVFDELQNFSRHYFLIRETIQLLKCIHQMFLFRSVVLVLVYGDNLNPSRNIQKPPTCKPVTFLHLRFIKATLHFTNKFSVSSELQFIT